MRYTKIKVFSATKARDRETLGEEVTRWLSALPKHLEVVESRVLQSSDAEFHCISIVLFIAPS